LSQTIKVEHGCGCLSGCGTLVVLWFLISGGTTALAWAEKNDGIVLGIMAAVILGGSLRYFTIKRVARNRMFAAQRAEAATAKVEAPAPVLPAPAPPAPSLKRCPMCAESVQAEARICRYCRHDFGAPVG
jgi:hypothetical protein